MRIAVLDDYQGVAQTYADWGTLDAVVDCFSEHIPDPAELVTRLAPYDVVVAMRERTPLTKAIIDALPGLRLIVTTGRVNASIDVAAARARGIEVCGTGSLSTGPAELTWALILGLSRHLVAETTSSAWQTTVGRDLAGKTLGVIGLGRIGSRVADVGRAMGMEILAWSPNLTPERAPECVPLDDLLARADVVSLHLVLSATTRGVFGARELAQMRPGALLVNTARAGLVDTAALIESLNTGHLGGAGIDVFDQEPLPADDPLRSAPHVLLTPHLGYVTEDVYRVFFTDAVEDIAAWHRGEPIRLLP